jgi:hypothetical protein
VERYENASEIHLTKKVNSKIDSFRKQIMIYDLINWEELETVRRTLSSFIQ